MGKQKFKGSLDLTQGTIWKVFLMFFIPIVAESLLQQLYTMADAIIVGRLAGKEALAAIDAIHPIVKLPIHSMISLSAGAGIVASRFFGAKDYAELKRTIHVGTAFVTVLGIVMSLLCFFGTDVILNMMSVPEDIYHMTQVYGWIYFSGIWSIAVYNMGAAMHRAVGNSRTPFYILIGTSALNVVLDYLFIGPLGWGIAGAAAATVASQIVSVIVVYGSLAKTDARWRFSIGETWTALCGLFSKERDLLLEIVHLGIPMAIQSALFAIANTAMQANINALGTEVIAAWSVCGKIEMLLWLFMDSLRPSMSTYVAQNYGAKRYDRVNKGLFTGIGIVAFLVCVLMGVYWVWTEPLCTLFIKPQDYGILPLCGEFMRIRIPWFVVYVFGQALSGTLAGTGNSVKSMTITLICTCVPRLVWSWFIIPLNPTMPVIISGFIASWFITAIGFIGYYIYFQGKERKKHAAEAAA